MKIKFLGTGAADWNFEKHKDLEGFRRNSSALIDDCLLIDPGADVPNALSVFKKNARAVKYIINTHWHGDHIEATAAFADLTGAKTLLGRDDLEKAKPYFTPDILVDDGDTLSLGNKTIRFVHTPGHTKGTVSVFYEDTDGVNTCRVGMFGGAGLNTLVPSRFDFEGCRDAYFASLERLKKERVDVFIGNHTWNNDTYGKYEKLVSTGENDFIDSDIWYRFLDEYKCRLKAIISKE